MNTLTIFTSIDADVFADSQRLKEIVDWCGGGCMVAMPQPPAEGEKLDINGDGRDEAKRRKHLIAAEAAGATEVGVLHSPYHEFCSQPELAKGDPKKRRLWEIDPAALEQDRKYWIGRYKWLHSAAREAEIPVFGMLDIELWYRAEFMTGVAGLPADYDKQLAAKYTEAVKRWSYYMGTTPALYGAGGWSLKKDGTTWQYENNFPLKYPPKTLQVYDWPSCYDAQPMTAAARLLHAANESDGYRAMIPALYRTAGWLDDWYYVLGAQLGAIEKAKGNIAAVYLHSLGKKPLGSNVLSDNLDRQAIEALNRGFEKGKA